MFSKLMKLQKKLKVQAYDPQRVYEMERTLKYNF